MNIAIVIHSQTGTTLQFGNLIAKKLKQKGHQVDLVELQTEGKVHPRATEKDFKITNLPNGKEYDALLVGCPVWAFAASPVLAVAVKNLKNIKGKFVLPFVTMGFPFKGWGGNQAISSLEKTLGEAGAKVLPGIIIPKMFHNFKKLMSDEAGKIPGMLR